MVSFNLNIYISLLCVLVYKMSIGRVKCFDETLVSVNVKEILIRLIQRVVKSRLLVIEKTIN